jgi:uncharacterized protein YcnI
MSTNRLRRRAAQAGVVLSAAGLAVLLGAGAASAHVTARVIGESAKQGGYTKITFRVPTEDATAGTIKLEVKFPADTPVSSLRTKPVAGWTATVNKVTLDKPVKMGDTEIKEAVGSVVWTANPGVRIGPSEFGEFEVSGGPMPANADKLVMPAVQTYDSGKVVSWIEAPPADGKTEPEHPAPVIQLAKAEPKGGDAHGGGAPGAAPAANANAQAGNSGGQSGTTAASATDSTDTTARWLGGIGLVVGALGLAVGGAATLRARRAIANTKVSETP